MREIEVKAKINDKNGLLLALKNANIELSAPKKQHDIVYSQPGAADNEPGANWLRVRIENDANVIFTLKRSVSGELDSIEHEVTVDNADEITKMIGYLGYELFSDLTKLRQKAKSGDIELCVDELPGLGTYIEAEKLCGEDADHEAVVAELWQLLESIGIDRTSEEIRGYDVIMRAQNKIPG